MRVHLIVNSLKRLNCLCGKSLPSHFRALDSNIWLIFKCKFAIYCNHVISVESAKNSRIVSWLFMGMSVLCISIFSHSSLNCSKISKILNFLPILYQVGILCIMTSGKCYFAMMGTFAYDAAVGCCYCGVHFIEFGYCRSELYTGCGTSTSC